MRTISEEDDATFCRSYLPQTRPSLQIQARLLGPTGDVLFNTVLQASNSNESTSDGFKMTELPAANAGAIFLIAIKRGWLKGSTMRKTEIMRIRCHVEIS